MRNRVRLELINYMDKIRDNIRNSLPLSVVVCLIIGVAINYGYSFVRDILAPVIILIGENFTNPYSEYIWLQTALLNLAFSAVCGFIVAVIALTVMQYLFKPKTMLFPQIAGVSYIIMSYWWFVSDVAGFTKLASSEHIWVVLLSALAAIIVWFLCAWWLVRKNAPNKTLSSDALTRTG